MDFSRARKPRHAPTPTETNLESLRVFINYFFFFFSWRNTANLPPALADFYLCCPEDAGSPVLLPAVARRAPSAAPPEKCSDPLDKTASVLPLPAPSRL